MRTQTLIIPSNIISNCYPEICFHLVYELLMSKIFQGTQGSHGSFTELAIVYLHCKVFLLMMLYIGLLIIQKSVLYVISEQNHLLS